MSIGARTGNLLIDDFTKIDNHQEQNSPILSFRVPASEYFLFPNDKPLNIFIPCKETITHGGGGVEVLSLDNKIVNSPNLSMAQTAVTDKGSITAIDYNDNEISVDHNVNEDITLHYLLGAGNLSILHVPRIALGSLRKILMQKSLLSIHAVDQFLSQSLLYLSRSGILPEKHHLQVWYEGDAEIDWHDDLGEIVIPYKAQPMSVMPKNAENKIMQGMTS